MRKPRTQRRGFLFFVLSAFTLINTQTRAEDFQGSTHMLEFNKPPILYKNKGATDPVAALNKSLRANRASGWKEYHPSFGYLPAVLDMLGVPVSSQMLVFSKTSVQRRLIDSENPRALYFSDNVYVGFIPGAPDLEIAAVDPVLGTVFYTVSQDNSEPVRFRRNDDCLSCHASARTMGVPGFVIRSLDTDAAAEIVAGTDTNNVTHCTPIEERWGSWLVSNAPQDWKHRGNAVGSGDTRVPIPKEHLSRVFSSPLYPSRGSEILPLLLHDHQTHMHNYITRLGMEGQERIASYGHLRYLQVQIVAFLRYLLFVEEAPLASPINASEKFIEAFQKNAKRDSKGRSLKDLDLKTRLFRFPCSFLIDSEAFRKMPTMVREAILAKLHQVLRGENPDPTFEALSLLNRKAILEILKATAPDLTAGW
jgi:hypothetical protein